MQLMLKEVLPIWMKTAFRIESQVLPSGGVGYDAIDCEACQGFSWPFCRKGLTSLQGKRTENRGSLLALDSQGGVTLSLQ